MPLTNTRIVYPRADIPMGNVIGDKVYADENWLRTFMQPLMQRAGGELAPSNSDIGKVTDGLSEDVSTLVVEVDDLEATAVRIDALGGATSVDHLRDLSLANQISAAGYTVLWVTASATGARCQNLHGIAQPQYYSRTGGTVVVRCSDFSYADHDRYIKVAFAKRSELTGFVRITSTTQIDVDTTEITGIEIAYLGGPDLVGTTARTDIVAGTVTDNTGLVHDCQSSTNTHPQITFLNTMVDGALDVCANMGISGSNTLDWQGVELRAYIDAMPYFDVAVCDFGYGNDLTDAAHFGYPDGSADIFARLDDNLTWIKKRARKVIFIGSEGARPGGDVPVGDPDYVATPYLSSDFTQLQQINGELRRMIAQRHPTVEYVDGESGFMGASLYGSTDTDDILRGIPPFETIDNKGIHRAPAGGAITSKGIGEAVLRAIRPYNPMASNRWDFKYGGTVPDLNGLLNANALYPWVGAVPTAAVTVFGLIFVGLGVEGTTCYGSGFTGNMSGRLSMRNRLRGGREMRLVFRDPVDGGADFTFEYRGTTAYPLLQALNDPYFRGVDLDLYGDFGFWGFKQNAVFRITFGLFATDVESGTEKMIAAWYSDDGIQTMLGGARAWVEGWAGVHRAGNGRIRIPHDKTYTDACIRFRFQGVPTGVGTFPMGEFHARFSGFQMRRRLPLAAPLTNSWS